MRACEGEEKRYFIFKQSLLLCSLFLQVLKATLNYFLRSHYWISMQALMKSRAFRANATQARRHHSPPQLPFMANPSPCPPAAVASTPDFLCC